MEHNIPILIDTEPETSIEHDVEEKVITVASNATQTTKSLFNVTFENIEDEDNESAEFKDYESRLHSEMKDWKTLLRSTYNELKKAKEKYPVIDKTILPPEKREYLEKAPCLQSFIRESLEFRQQAHIFLELDYPEVMDMVANLEDICERRINLVKAQKMRENLANYPRTLSNSR
ncbi:kinetochore Mis12-Ndc80 network component 1 [Haematobia irritans]|uniref:kinetochore Mis12-Ndc80 network component 1 n=1 Tax=Haematobia irritans TaxID=7368 RepID=UPI003F508486